MDIAKIRKKAHTKDIHSKNKEERIETEKVDAGESGVKDREQQTVEQIEAPRRQEENKSGEDENEEDILELVTFSISDEEFAFMVSEVEEVIKHQKLTRVPTMPDYVLGITSLRGKVIPVIDLKARLGHKKVSMSDNHTCAEAAAKSETEPDKKIVIVSGTKGLIGATIDRVTGVVRFSNSNMLEPPAHLTEAELKFIDGVVIFEKRFISILRSEVTMDIEDEINSDEHR